MKGINSGDECLYIYLSLSLFMARHLKVHICAPTSHREKKLLVSSEDYGRDLTGVQNLRKKHKRLEAELGAHEPAIQVQESSVYPIHLYKTVAGNPQVQLITVFFL